MDTHHLSEEKEILQDRAARLGAPQAEGILQLIAAVVVEAAEGVDERLSLLQKHLTLVELANQLTRIECQVNAPVN